MLGECPQCKASNPEGKRYCGDCGAPLESDLLADADLRARIRAVIKEDLGNQKVVEVEIAEAVVRKIQKWAKLLAFFSGIPLVALLALLGWLGARKYNNLWAVATAAENRINLRAKTLTTKLGALEPKAEQLTSQLSDLEPKVATIKADSDRIASFVNNANGKIGELKIKVTGIQSDVVKLLKQGIERWPVKTGADADARLVASTPINTTVERLVGLPIPTALAGEGWPDNGLGPFQSARARPVELTVYIVEAAVGRYKLETDGDFHIVLEGQSGATMVAEVPDPDPAFLPAVSRWARQISAVRREVDDKLHPEFGFWKVGNVRVRITGVGFFDRFHHQMGAAVNGIELHPVIDVRFLP